jgi:hypothetical protein
LCRKKGKETTMATETTPLAATDDHPPLSFAAAAWRAVGAPILLGFGVGLGLGLGLGAGLLLVLAG